MTAKSDYLFQLYIYSPGILGAAFIFIYNTDYVKLKDRS